MSGTQVGDRKRGVSRVFGGVVFVVSGLLALIILYLIWLQIDHWRTVGDCAAGQAIYSLGTLITALAIVGTAVTGYLAYAQASKDSDTQNAENAKTAKIQKTIDFIHRQTHDKDILDIIDTCRHIKNKYSSRDGNTAIALKMVIEDDDNYEKLLVDNRSGPRSRRSDLDCLMRLFNYYESLAIGIKNGALDNDILKSWWRTTYVKNWMFYKTLIKDHRRKYEITKAFVEFEELAKKWANEDEMDLC